MHDDIQLKLELQLRASDVGGIPFPLAQLGNGHNRMQFIMARVVHGTIEVLDGWRSGGLPTLAECRLKNVRLQLRNGQLYTQNGLPLLNFTTQPRRLLDLSCFVVRLDHIPVQLSPGPDGPTGRMTTQFLKFDP